MAPTETFSRPEDGVVDERDVARVMQAFSETIEGLDDNFQAPSILGSALGSLLVRLIATELSVCRDGARKAALGLGELLLFLAETKPEDVARLYSVSGGPLNRRVV